MQLSWKYHLALTHNSTVFTVCKNHHLHFRPWMIKFFGCGEFATSKHYLRIFNLSSKSHIRVTLTAIIQFKKFSLLLNGFKCSRTILRCVRFCASVNACGTHHTATFFLTWSWSSTVAMIAILVLSIAVEEHLGHRLSYVLTLPSLKYLCHHWTVLLTGVAFPQTSFNEVWMMGTLFPCGVSIFMYACVVRTLQHEPRHFLLHLQTALTSQQINETTTKITTFCS